MVNKQLIHLKFKRYLIKKKKKNCFQCIVFLWWSGFKPQPYIFYALSLPTELCHAHNDKASGVYL